MLTVLRQFISFLTRLILSLRYRIQLHGMEQLKDLEGPLLILPNHPGFVDPPIIFAHVAARLQARPLVYESNYRNPVIHPFMRIYRAIEVPDLEQASMEKRDQIKEIVEKVIEGLKAGNNHILWPAGRLERDGTEKLGGARAASDILKEVPEATVVLIRTRGVWGTSFSYAMTGKLPSLVKRLLQGIGYLLLNLLFFMPRRKVDITLKVVPPEEIPGRDRRTLNPWLESFYNEHGPEEPTYVHYHFLNRFLWPSWEYEYPEPKGIEHVDLSGVKDSTKETVEEILSQQVHRPLTDEEKLPASELDQLGLDSLDRLDITLEIEQRFGFPASESPKTVGQLWALAEGLVDSGPPKPAPPKWFKAPSDNEPTKLLGETIPEAFVARALAHPKDTVIADDLSGVLNYERALLGAWLMAKQFRAIEAKNVGLMLPASVAADLAFLGLHLAGKLPVVLNWTTGPGNLAHAARVMKLTHVITSKKFIDRAAVEVQGTEYVYLEDVKKNIGTFSKIAGLLKVKLLGGSIQSGLPKVNTDDPGVVLFTSGSEKAPKAVPLTHGNLLSDIRLGGPVLGLRRDDVFLGFLPAFHSFGMTVTLLFPILTGMRVVHHPDPTDASALVKKLANYKPTFLAGTPTFISHILDRSETGDLDSLRMIVVGAEKCPDHVFKRAKELAPNAVVIEGYGITECAPVISVDPPDNPRNGSVGKPFPGLEVEIVDLDSGEVLPAGKQGMIQVSGPTVFPGYLDYDGPSPFEERDGKKWYVTGDLGELDEDGYLWFRGRLKRFLKAGGEMISLPALEEPFSQSFPPTEEGPRVAVEGIETPHGRQIVLFTKEPITLQDANAKLTEEGFRGVMRLDEVRQVEEIPVLGTGKTDYKILRGKLETETEEKAQPSATAS